jgi:hypothetical protein
VPGIHAINGSDGSLTSSVPMASNLSRTSACRRWSTISTLLRINPFHDDVKGARNCVSNAFPEKK